MYPAGSHDDWRENIMEVDNWRAVPGSGLCWQHCGVAAKLQPKNRHLVHLVTDLQGEVEAGTSAGQCRGRLRMAGGSEHVLCTGQTLSVCGLGHLAALAVAKG
jgi:hypothetical protein